MKFATIFQKVREHLYLRQNIDEDHYMSELLQIPSRSSLIINNIGERRLIIGLDNYHNGHHRH